MKTCAMIAGRDDQTEIRNEYLENIIPLLYDDFHVRKILSGIHKGRELAALDFLLRKKRMFPRLRVHGVFTHEEEANLWNEGDREKLFHAIRNCDEEWILKPISGTEMRFQRNIVMMDTSDMIFLLGRDNEIEFWASKLKKPILRFNAECGEAIPNIRLFRKQMR